MVINKRFKHTEETKKKLSQINLGKKLSKETRSKMSTSQKGHLVSEETRRKIGLGNSISNKGQIPWIKGKHQSEETKQKISKIHKGKKLSEEHRKIISLTNKGRIFSKERNLKLSRSLKIKFLTDPDYRELMRSTKAGRKFSEETKKKIGLKSLGRIPKNKGLKHEDFYGKEKAKIIKDKIRNKRKIQITPVEDTRIEKKIQNFLDALKIEYFIHKYIKIKHGYQCDIFIPSLNLVIECDGNYWHKYPTGTDLDRIRTQELIGRGFKVLRLWESEINSMDINKFKEKLNL